MQPNAELLKYIQEQTGQGWSIDQILPELRSFGWPEEEIQVALAWLSSQPPEVFGDNGMLPPTQDIGAADQIAYSTETTEAVAPLAEPALPPAEQPPPVEPVVQPLSSYQEPIQTPQIPSPSYIQQNPEPYVNSDPAGQYPAQAPAPTLQSPPEVMQQPVQPLQTPPAQAVAAILPAALPPVQQPFPNQNPPQSLQPQVVAPTQPLQPPPTLQPTNPMPTVPPAQPAYAPLLGSQAPKRRFKRLVSVIFITAAVTGATILLWSIFHENPQTTLKKTVQNSLLNGTFERDYTDDTAGDGLKIHAKIKSDFSNTAEPKSMGNIEATLEFGPESTVVANYDMVAIEDTVWLRPSSLKLDLSEATRTTYQQLAQGGSIDNIIASLVGIGTLNQWTEYSYNPTFVSSYGLSYSLVRISFALNSPLAPFPVANTSTHNNTAVSLVLHSGMISFDYKSVSSESVDSKRYKVFKATFSSKEFIQTSKNIAELLDLSQRHRDAISEKDIAVEDGEFKLWVDQKTHLPYKLDAPRDGLTVLFVHFGGGYDIKSPL